MNILDLLKELVACRTDEREEALVALLAQRLEPWGAQIRVQEVTPGRPNLIATFAGRDPNRSMLLEAHADTVGGDCPPTPVLRGTRLCGRGTCDTKGAMAALLGAIREVLERDGQPPVTLHFATTCNEESGAAGAYALMADGFRADMALVGEPTGMTIVRAHKGAIRLRIHTDGVAAHSSNPRNGVNAIYRMRPVLEALERWQPSTRHPRLGAPTLSVGTIQGGTQVNVVPAHCCIDVDRRLLPGEDRAAVVRELTAGFDVRFEETEYYPPLEEDCDSPVALRLAAACRAVLGRAEFTVAPWGSNAGVFKAAGIPSVLFGPGSVAQAHTKDEFVETDQVLQASRVYAAFIRGAGN
jgi:acetylornithine deacetylase